MKTVSLTALISLTFFTGALAQEPLPISPAKVDPATVGDTISEPETALPLTPEQVEAGRIKTEGTSLVGGASKSNLSGVATLAPASPLSRYRGPKLVFVSVKLRNNGDEPILLMGDSVKGELSSGARVEAVGKDKIIKLDNSLLSAGGKAVVAGVSAASLGLAGPICYELLTPQEHRARGMGTATGRDAGRHEVEEGRLNRRVILPQDETTGWVAFTAEEGQTMKNLVLPILMRPFNATGGTITIPIRAAVTK